MPILNEKGVIANHGQINKSKVVDIHVEERRKKENN